MRQGNDQVTPLFLHLGYVSLRRFDYVTRLHVAFQMLAIPVHDLRRSKSDDTNLDRMLAAIPHFNLTLKDGIGLHQSRIIAGGRPSLFCNIGQNHREFCTSKRLFKEI